MNVESELQINIAVSLMLCLNLAGYAIYFLNYIVQFLKQLTLVYFDDINAICLSKNLVQHQHTKHIEIDIHFVREKVVRSN